MSVSCGLTNVNLNEGDKVGFVLLSRSELHETRSLASHYGFSDFDNNTDLYKPVLPPVYGELGEYRELINVEDSATASALTHLFQRPVTDILRCISSSYSMYNRNSGIYKTYFSGNENWNTFGTSRKDAFKALGFTCTDNYSRIQHYTFGGYTISVELSDWNDAKEEYLTVTWSITNDHTGEILKDRFIATDIAIVIEHFSQITNLYPGFNPDDYERIALLNSLYGTFFLKEPYETMRDYRNNVDPSVRKDFFYSRWQEMMEFIKDNTLDAPLVKAMMAPYLRETNLPTDVKLLDMYTNPADIYPIYEFVEVMGMLNKVITPSLWGTAFSSDEASQKLLDATNLVLAKRQIERDVEEEKERKWELEQE